MSLTLHNSRPFPCRKIYFHNTDSHLRFDIWFEVRSQAAQRKLSGIPQLVAEMTITLHTKYVKINIPSCRIKYNKESQVSLFSISWTAPLEFRNLNESLYHRNFTLPPQDLFSNSPYCLPYNSHEVSLENVVLDQLIIPSGYFSLFPSIVCFILYWYCREKLCLITHGSQTVNTTRTLTLRSVSTKCKPQSISATLWYAIRIIFFL